MISSLCQANCYYLLLLSENVRILKGMDTITFSASGRAGDPTTARPLRRRLRRAEAGHVDVRYSMTSKENPKIPLSFLSTTRINPI